MTRPQVYASLRSSGLSCEDADALAEAVEYEGPIVARCVVLTAQGGTREEVGKALGTSATEVSRVLSRIKEKTDTIFV
jgi:hypothetical protein